MSKVHVATSSPRLRRFLHERKLDRLSSLLAERGLLQGEWLPEHAAMQLSESSRCASEPRWVAWRSPCRSDDAADGGSSPRIVLLWAEDARAARRAVLALDLRRACPVRVLLPRGHVEQLARCAYEAESGAIELELDRADAAPPCPQPGGALGDGTPLPAAAGWPARDYEAWAGLLERRGEALEQLRARRAAAAAEDERLARGKLEELSRLLLGLDPAATVEAELEGGRGEGGAVRYALVVQACVDDGHNVSWGGAVDRYTGVPDLLRAIRASCACC